MTDGGGWGNANFALDDMICGDVIGLLKSSNLTSLNGTMTVRVCEYYDGSFRFVAASTPCPPYNSDK
jgi:hypothetical protein